MEIKLHTYDVQKLDIALLCYKSDKIITDDDKKRISGILTKLNNACTKENDYTITLIVDY